MQLEQPLSCSRWEQTELTAFAHKGLLSRPCSRHTTLLALLPIQPLHRVRNMPGVCLLPPHSRPRAGDAIRTKFRKHPNPSPGKSRNVKTAFRNNKEREGWGKKPHHCQRVPNGLFRRSDKASGRGVMSGEGEGKPPAERRTGVHRPLGCSPPLCLAPSSCQKMGSEQGPGEGCRRRIQRAN